MKPDGSDLGWEQRCTQLSAITECNSAIYICAKWNLLCTSKFVERNLHSPIGHAYTLPNATQVHHCALNTQGLTALQAAVVSFLFHGVSLRWYCQQKVH